MLAKCVACIIVLLLSLNDVLSRPCDSQTKGYFWRDFYGEIPEDALPGGVDINGNPIYIGQVLFEALLVPANIHQNDKAAYFEYGGPKSATENIKILCASDFEKFEWVQTKNDEVHLLTGRHLVIGGYEKADSNVTTYIGRALVGGDTTVGKVLVGNDHYVGLLVVNVGKAFNFKTFDVLTYNPDKIIDPDVAINEVELDIRNQ